MARLAPFVGPGGGVEATIRMDEALNPCGPGVGANDSRRLNIPGTKRAYDIGLKGTSVMYLDICPVCENELYFNDELSKKCALLDDHNFVVGWICPHCKSEVIYNAFK